MISEPSKGHSDLQTDIEIVTFLFLFYFIVALGKWLHFPPNIITGSNTTNTFLGNASFYDIFLAIIACSVFFHFKKKMISKFSIVLFAVATSIWVLEALLRILGIPLESNMLVAISASYSSVICAVSASFLVKNKAEINKFKSALFMKIIKITLLVLLLVLLPFAIAYIFALQV